MNWLFRLTKKFSFLVALTLCLFFFQNVCQAYSPSTKSNQQYRVYSDYVIETAPCDCSFDYEQFQTFTTNQREEIESEEEFVFSHLDLQLTEKSFFSFYSPDSGNITVADKWKPALARSHL